MFSNFFVTSQLLDRFSAKIFRPVNRSTSWRRDINARAVHRGHRKGVYQCRTIAMLSERGSDNLARRKAENSSTRARVEERRVVHWQARRVGSDEGREGQIPRCLREPINHSTRIKGSKDEKRRRTVGRTTGRHAADAGRSG